MCVIRCMLMLSSMLAVVVGCTTGGEGRTASESADSRDPETLARLNGETIYVSDFEEFLDYSGAGEASAETKKDLFRDYVIRRLIRQEALKEGMVILPAEVEKYVDQWTLSGFTEEGFDEHVHDFLLVQKFLAEKLGGQVEVKLQEVLNYYSSHEEDYIVGDQAHVWELLVDKRSEAERMRAQLVDGDIRAFKEMARKYSKGSTAKSGGDLGIFTRGDLPEEFEKVIFAMKPGEISVPFHSGNGYHLFLMEEWIPRHAQKFFEVQHRIFEDLVAGKERVALDKFLNDLVRDASIEIYDSKLQF
ncbi:MAG TPA: peptidylprolyl isomerase [Acidobacteriota bacterium]|nr:peptidylprolyl isomerase [Acidobacteriota bacterium]